MTDSTKLYPAKVFWSAEDSGFIAVAHDLPGCSAFGQSESEALAELREAIAVWLEAADAAGNRIPEPTDFASQRCSGKVLLRLPKSLHRTLVDGAEAEGVSVNQHMVALLSVAATCRSIEVLCRQSVSFVDAAQSRWLMYASSIDEAAWTGTKAVGPIASYFTPLVSYPSTTALQVTHG